MRLPNPCLCLVTDSGFRSPKEFLPVVEAAIAGGVNCVQYREKSGLTDRAIYERGLDLAGLCRRLGVPLIVDDRLDIAMAIEADGVHVGQSDLPLMALRRLWPRAGFWGVSAASVELAHQAFTAGADYVGVGALFPTQTKTDTEPCPPAKLAAIREALGERGQGRIMAIGGINRSNVGEVVAAGCHSVAVVSAIWAAADPTAAAREFRAALAK